MSVSESNLTSIIGQIVSFKCASKASSASSSKTLRLLEVEDPSTPAELLAAEKNQNIHLSQKLLIHLLLIVEKWLFSKVVRKF